LWNNTKEENNMCNNPITVKVFGYYLGQLRKKLLSDESASFLSDSFVLMLLERDLLNSKTSSYSTINALFRDEEKPIEQVAEELHSELLKLYMDYPDNENKENAIGELHLALRIKNLLRLIKYSCTIINEAGKKKSVFQLLDALDVIKADNSLNPANWVYIDFDKFVLKVLFCTSTDNCLDFICPITNYRLTEVFSINSGFRKAPLLILSELNYLSSIRNLINKRIKEAGIDELSSASRSLASILYHGRYITNFETTCTSTFKELQKRIRNYMTQHKYDDYEVVITAEYVPMRCYGVAVCFKLFVFEKVEDVGYVLQSFISGSMEDTVSVNIFYTKAISWFFISDILHTCLDFFKLGAKEETLEKPDSFAPRGEKIYYTVKMLEEAFDPDEVPPVVPNVIVYPQ
jgi:hypothetical protein